MYHGGTPIWRLHTGLYKFVRNISTNIDLKLGEVSSLCIFYNIAISWLNPQNGFRFNFLLRDSAYALLSTFYQNALHLTRIHCATFTRVHCATNNPNWQQHEEIHRWWRALYRFSLNSSKYTFEEFKNEKELCLRILYCREMTTKVSKRWNRPVTNLFTRRKYYHERKLTC